MTGSEAGTADFLAMQGIMPLVEAMLGFLLSAVSGVAEELVIIQIPTWE